MDGLLRSRNAVLNGKGSATGAQMCMYDLVANHRGKASFLSLSSYSYILRNLLGTVSILLTTLRTSLSCPGITNGVDVNDWNPATDRHISSQYVVDDLVGKVCSLLCDCCLCLGDLRNLALS